MDMTTFVLAKNYADKQIEKAEMGDIELDNTLTKQGFAADAKAVGDKLNSIKIPAIDSTLSVEGAAADARIVGNMFRDNMVVQSDWDETDTSQMDYIKNKPFGYEANWKNQSNTTLSWTHISTDDQMGTLSLEWDQKEFITLNNLYEFTPGKVYLINFYGSSEYVKIPDDANSYSGVIKTKRITFEYLAEMDMYITILSEPPSYRTESAVLSIIPAELKKIDNQFIDFSSIAQSDWNQNNQEAGSYVKNRPCYEYGVERLFVDNQTANITAEDMQFSANLSVVEGAAPVVAGQQVRIVIDGVSYYATTYATGTGNRYIKADLNDLGYSGYEFDFSSEGYVELYAFESKVNATISIYAIDPQVVKLDNKFIDSAEELSVEDIRPIQNSTVTKAINVLTQKIEGGTRASQTNWDQLDSTQSDFILNKPFGITPKTTYCDAHLSYHEEWDEDGMGSWLIWDNNLVGGLLGASQPSGTIAIILGDRMEIAQHTSEWNSGTLQTSFITIEWNYNRWSVAEPLSFTITSAPTSDLENPCKLVIMQVEVKKIDNTYIDFPQSDWNETDETKSSYIQNRTHYDESFGKWEELARVRGERYYDEMDGYRYKTMTEAEVNIDIQFGYEYSILLYDANDDMGFDPGHQPDNGDKVRPYYKDGPEMETWDCISYNDVEYKDNIGIITLPYATSGLAIYRHQILSPMKQLDEKFIPNTIARTSQIMPSVQADWVQTDSTSSDYIKNKPFGVIQSDPILDFELGWTVQDTEDGMGSERFWNATTIVNDSIRTPIQPGQYLVSFFNQSAVVELTESSGTIETDFITLSYYLDRWSDTTRYTVISEPPTWESGSSQLIIAPIEIKKLDSIYVDGSQSDWNETDPDHAGYIQNKPFGKELGEECANVNLEWYSYEEEMSTYYAWSNSVFNVYRYLTPGTYQLTFDNNSADIRITNSYSGRIETDFIILEYNWDDMDGCAQFSIVSGAPQIWEYNSAKLTLAPITFTTIDLNYLPNGITDWNEADESKASYIKNRTHWDTQTTEWKQVAYQLGQDSMDGYETFTSVEVNVPIKYNCEYSISTTKNRVDPSYYLRAGQIGIQSYDYGMGDYAIVYDGITYYDNIGTMTFENGITGIAIYERQIIAPMKQLDEKFIPDTIARVTELEALISDMYYKPGDSVSVRITTGGVLTAGGETVWFTIPLCKPRKNIQSVSVDADYSCLIRQDGNYLLGSATEYAQASSIGFDLSSPDFILANLKFDTVPEGAVNNDTVGVTFYATLTFA